MKVYLDMIGCRLNQSELEVIARQFTAAGHTLVEDPAQAELAVVNTCTVTAAAAADSRKTIRRIARSGSARIISTGCWSEMVPEKALNLPSVIDVVSNQDKDQLVANLLALPEEEFELEPLERVPVPGSRQRTRAFIKAQDGCRHRCAFCITTAARGESRSESPASVIREVQAAVRAGIKEIALTGVQLGSWGMDLKPRSELHQLVTMILEETEIPRIRLSSIEPWDITLELIDVVARDRVARHLHLPLQSGSAATLRRMSRAINPERYADLVAAIRSRIPDIALTTDILTGFPGESVEEYQEGLDFIHRMEFAGGHVFTYSARKGTPAADFPDQVPHRIRKERSAQIRELLQKSASSYREGFLEAELDVLWEQVESDPDGRWIGRGLTDNYLRVEAEVPLTLWNQFSVVKIQEVTPQGVSGQIVEN
jgi:threonylcarbamoyladenosine tRNA methylthiotransferase MtaB